MVPSVYAVIFAFFAKIGTAFFAISSSKQWACISIIKSNFSFVFVNNSLSFIPMKSVYFPIKPTNLHDFN